MPRDMVVFLDTFHEPDSRPFEGEFFQRVRDTGFKSILGLDDIHYNSEKFLEKSPGGCGSERQQVVRRLCGTRDRYGVGGFQCESDCSKCGGINLSRLRYEGKFQSCVVLADCTTVVDTHTRIETNKIIVTFFDAFAGCQKVIYTRIHKFGKLLRNGLITI